MKDNEKEYSQPKINNQENLEQIDNNPRKSPSNNNDYQPLQEQDEEWLSSSDIKKANPINKELEDDTLKTENKQNINTLKTHFFIKNLYLPSNLRNEGELEKLIMDLFFRRYEMPLKYAKMIVDHKPNEKSTTYSCKIGFKYVTDAVKLYDKEIFIDYKLLPFKLVNSYNFEASSMFRGYVISHKERMKNKKIIIPNIKRRGNFKRTRSDSFHKRRRNENSYRKENNRNDSSEENDRRRNEKKSFSNHLNSNNRSSNHYHNSGNSNDLEIKERKLKRGNNSRSRSRSRERSRNDNRSRSGSNISWRHNNSYVHNISQFSNSKSIQNSNFDKKNKDNINNSSNNNNFRGEIKDFKEFNEKIENETPHEQEEEKSCFIFGSSKDFNSNILNSYLKRKILPYPEKIELIDKSIFLFYLY